MKEKPPPKPSKEKPPPKPSKEKLPPKPSKEKSPSRASKATSSQPSKEKLSARASRAESTQKPKSTTASKAQSPSEVSKQKSHKRKLSEATASSKASAGKALKVGKPTNSSDMDDNPWMSPTQQSPPQNKLSYQAVILQQVHNKISEASRDAFDSPDDKVICIQCGETLCDWLRFGAELLSEARSTYPCVLGDRSSCSARAGDGVTRNVVRKFIYKNYVYSKYGSLGKGIRINIPECVLQKVRAAYPEDDGNYMGHKDS